MRLLRTLWIFFTHVHHAIRLSWTVARYATDRKIMDLPQTTIYEIVARHFCEMAGWDVWPKTPAPRDGDA